MSLLGYLLAGGVAMLLLALLPFLAVTWVVYRALGRSRADRGPRNAEPTRTT